MIVEHTRTFTAVYQYAAPWWIGWLTDLPGANGQGHTLEEARISLCDAATMLLELGEPSTPIDTDNLIPEGAVRERLAV